MIPFSLIVSRTPLVVWTTSPLVPLLFPWPSTASVSGVARGSRSIRFGPFASRPTLWPPPPSLVCALYPVVRVLYGRLLDRITQMVVQDIDPTRTQAARQRQLQRRVQQGIQEQQEQQPRGDQQDRLQQLRIRLQARQQQQLQPQRPQQQQQQMPAGHAAGRRFHFQFGELFGFEIDHFVFFRNPPAPRDPVPAPAAAVVEDAVNGGAERAVDQPADQQQQPHLDGPIEEPERDPEDVVPADQEPQQEQQQPPPEPQQQQQAEPGEGQEPVPPPPERDEDALGAVAERAIRVTGASIGRLIGGALLMPSIARMMGSVLLHISHVVPLMRTIIAPLPPPLPFLPLQPSGPIGTLIRLIRGARPNAVLVDHGHPHGWLSGNGLGAALLRGLLSTSQEWSTSDPVWYVSFFRGVHPSIFTYHVLFTPLYTRWRNTLGLGIFLVVSYILFFGIL